MRTITAICSRAVHRLYFVVLATAAVLLFAGYIPLAHAQTFTITGVSVNRANLTDQLGVSITGSFVGICGSCFNGYTSVVLTNSATAATTSIVYGTTSFSFLSETQIGVSAHVPRLATDQSWTARVIGPTGTQSNIFPFTVPADLPSITSISPNPVTGSNTAQSITINGRNFSPIGINGYGPNVTLRNVDTGDVLSITITTASQTPNTVITVQAVFGVVAHNWTAQVTNLNGGLPGGEATTPFPFQVVAPSLPPAQLTISPASLNFGSVQVGSYSDADIAVQHVSGTAATTGSATSSGAFQVLSGSNFALSNGGASTVRIRFAPTAATPYTGTVTFNTNATFTGASSVSLSGTGTNATPSFGAITVNATLDGSPWNGSVNYSVSGPMSFSGNNVSADFQNRSAGTYTVSYISGGPANSIFSAVSPSSTQTLAGGGSVVFTLIFASAAVPPRLSINPANTIVGAAAGSTSFTVSNTGGGTFTYSANVSIDSSWLRISSGGAGGNSGTIAVTYDGNPGIQRTGSLIVTAPGAIGSPTAVTVTQSSPVTTSIFRIGARVMAGGPGVAASISREGDDSSLIYVRNSQLEPLFQQSLGVHGSIVGGPMPGMANGDNWWQISWDSQPPDQAGIRGWSAESVISPAPSSGDVTPQPDFTAHYYRQDNIFWQSGYAPDSTAPLHPQLGSALGNCTWYVHGRLRELAYNPIQLDAMHGNANEWSNETTTSRVDTIPSRGAIAYLGTGSFSSLGHVAVVESVNADGTITVTESSYAASVSSRWNFLWRHRTVSPRWFSQFIHVDKVANVPSGLTGLWWNANESGWGIHVTQRSNVVFAAWYTYDMSGSPKWYVSTCTMPADTTGTNGTCEGALLEVNGPLFFGSAFNPSLANVATAGTLQLAFQTADTASMTYTLAGQTRTVPISRQPLGTNTVAPSLDYTTDLWWNPSESGWGLAIAQQSSTMFLAWYVYDNGGKPVWYVATCTLAGTTCSASLLRTTGPAFGPSFDSSQVHVSTVGSISVNFTDGNNAVLIYTVNGASGSKNITRQLF
jgi:surface antigen